ncbi:hypothetical protein I7I50_09165 [Histoplasma capsulatum G186AR]|uniref:Uncharacterized protein n=1 Tax=Ajellomyces capsulatus TaxID=5037 RepID=A0A8H8D041_AJECA|nr:hypothetical protein I7I52_06686 [Histoplasma capsulatum]QSS74115.1 hypothetical protein I7I50_09165 [Histoplasma capsulatum G186AR]
MQTYRTVAPIKMVSPVRLRSVPAEDGYSQLDVRWTGYVCMMAAVLPIVHRKRAWDFKRT